jgi:hypothetical protein
MHNTETNTDNSNYPNLPGKPYSSAYDDGSTRGMTHVNVPGLPGTYPQGAGRADRARQARTYGELLNDPSTTRQDLRVERVVDQINGYHRVTDPEEAHLAAHYEDTVRAALPLGRDALRQSTEAYDGFIDTHGAMEDHLPQDNDYPTSADYRKAREEYEAALGPELAERGTQLQREMEGHDLALRDMVSTLDHRDRQATADYHAGVDNTAQVAAQDAERFAQYIPPKQ